MALLTVIIPTYNEAKTVRQIIERVNIVPIDKEIIVVDDGSSDGTDRILRDIRLDNLKVIFHGSNRGKGSALLTGLLNASGEYVIIQDADLEYDPQDYLKLLNEIRPDKCDLVLGARFTKGYQGMLLPKLGNRIITNLLNLLFGSGYNDFFTCYKMAKKTVFDSLHLKSKGFEIEIEIASKALKNILRIKEIPVSYHPRNYSEGKKIRIKDGLFAVLTILKYRFFS